jgi:mannose-6-phosphate isomerase-like protein (cupin superfamily)
MTAIARSPLDGACFRISPDDTNYFVILADPAGDGVPFITVVEIFEPGGRTPPNKHEAAWEQFVVLRGNGLAHDPSGETIVRQGDVLVVPPGFEHALENTGPGKLYCLTTMMPDEGFSALIRRGVPAVLDEEDRAVLTGLVTRTGGVGA